MAERRTIKKNTPAKPSPKAKPVKERTEKERLLIREIWGIGITVFGIFTLIGYIGIAGTLGTLVKKLFFGLFGNPAYLLPFAIIAVGLYLMIKHNLKIGARVYLSLTGILICLSCMFHLFSGIEVTPSEFFMYGTIGMGGGLIGGIIETPLSNLTGNVGSFLILFALLIVCVMVLTAISVSDVIEFVKKLIANAKKENKEKKADKITFEYEKVEPATRKTTKTLPAEDTFNPDDIKIFSHDQLGFDQAVSEDEKKAVQTENEPPSAVKPVTEQEKAEPPVPTHEIEEEIKKNKVVIEYKYPSVSLLEKHSSKASGGKPEDLRESAKKLVETLDSFGVKAKVLEVSRGPSVTRFELQPSAGVKISKIVNLADDIALNLAAFGVRIEAPIPGKAAVGIEIPNKTVATVSLREVLDSSEFKTFGSKTAFALGKDISGKVIVADISKMPHLLIAGATGSGKSVCINTLISSILYKSSPDEVKLLMIDPKVVELGVYNGIPHLLIPVVTDPRKAAGALNWAVTEMTRRYKLFADCNVRDINGYNEYAKGEDLQSMERIIIIIDELADLMMVAPRDVEDAICRLAQLARAAGMHLVIATQRPSVDVITGLIKANIPSRISFAVSSQIDSRTVLDMMGAEKLLGRGDMLYLPMGASKPTRIQGAFVSDKEVEAIVDFVKTDFEAEYDEDIIESIERQDSPADDDPGDNDELLKEAIEIVVDSGQASVSMIQRRLKVGYARAGRIIDQMEARGIIGPHEGSKARSVLITKQQLYEMSMNSEEE